MGDSEYFDVPYCRVERTSLRFSELNATKGQSISINDQVVSNPGSTTHSQTKDRSKYTNKLIKQLKEIGVDVDTDTGLVTSDSPVSHSDYFSDQEVDKALLNIADETLDALSEQNMDVEDELAGWDPMKEAFEQKHFNSYQEPSYDAPFTEKHNPVRGTRISPAKGAADEVTLYVSNIPIHLTEDALKNMFALCGKLRRVKKCRPKISDSNTTFGFVAYSKVREAEEAITRYDRFQFGKDCQLRVRLSREKERNLVPNEVDIRLGKENSSESENAATSITDMNTSKEYQNTKETVSTPSTDMLYPNMFTKTSPEKEIIQNTVKRGPRLYFQGLSVRTTKEQLQDMVNELAECRDCCVVSPKHKSQYTTFGFATVGSVEDADKIIEHYRTFGSGKLKVTYSVQSAKEFGIESEKTEEDEYYLKLYNDPGFAEDDGPSVRSDPKEVVTDRSSPDNNEDNVVSTLGNLHGLSVLENAINISSSKDKTMNIKTEEKMTIADRKKTPDKEPDFLEESMISSITKDNYVPIKSLSKCGGVEASLTRMSVEGRGQPKQIIEKPKQGIEKLDQSIGNTKQDFEKHKQSIEIPKTSSEHFHEDQKSLQAKESQVNDNVDTIDNHIVESVEPVRFSKPDMQLQNEPCLKQTSPVSLSKPGMKNQNDLCFAQPSSQKTEKPSEDTAGELKASQEQTGTDIANELIQFTVSSLPAKIHPFELVAQKMVVQNLYNDFYKVNVTHVETPYLIYGILVDSKSSVNSQLEKLSADMATFFGDTSKHGIKFNFRAGALAAFHDQGVWKRGIITKIAEDSCDVFLIDSGVTMQCQQKHLTTLPKQFISLPAQAIPMKLFNIKPCDNGPEWATHVVEFLRELLSQQSVVFVKPEFKDRMSFAVRITIGEQSTDKLLEEKGFAKRIQVELPQIASKVDQPNRFYDVCDVMNTEKPPCVPFEAYVTFAQSPKHFYLRSLEQTKDLKVDEIEKELKNHFQCHENISNTDQVLSPGQLCAVKLDDEHWYRGFIWRIYADSAKIWLVDYGSSHDIPLDCVHPLPGEYQIFPAQCIKSQLQYVTPVQTVEYSEQNCERFKELVCKRVLVVKVVKSTENVVRVLLFDKLTGIDIGEQLVREGQAQYFTKGQQYFGERPSVDYYEVSQDSFIKRPTALNPRHQHDPPFDVQNEIMNHPATFHSPPKGISQNQNKERTPVYAGEKESSSVSLTSPPREISQKENEEKSPVRLDEKESPVKSPRGISHREQKSPGRGMILGRGMALIKDRGLLL